MVSKADTFRFELNMPREIARSRCKLTEAGVTDAGKLSERDVKVMAIALVVIAQIHEQVLDQARALLSDLNKLKNSDESLAAPATSSKTEEADPEEMASLKTDLQAQLLTTLKTAVEVYKECPEATLTHEYAFKASSLAKPHMKDSLERETTIVSDAAEAADQVLKSLFMTRLMTLLSKEEAGDAPIH